MSVPIVIDEWLISDLAGVNGPDKQEESVRLLYKILKICDKIVILEDSPFEQKIFDLKKSSSGGVDPALRVSSQIFYGLIYNNKDKVHTLAQSDISPLPANITTLVSHKDHYLFQCYLKLKNKGSFIVTTDCRWNHTALRKKKFDIRKRDDFIREYLTRT